MTISYGTLIILPDLLTLTLGYETQDLNIDVMTACSSHDLSQLYTNACSKVLL